MASAIAARKSKGVIQHQTRNNQDPTQLLVAPSLVPTLQMHGTGFESSRSSPEGPYAFPTPVYGQASADSSASAASFPESSTMTHLPYQSQPRTAYDDQSGTYLNVGSTPTPVVKDFSPQRGAAGMKMRVTITTLYEIMTTNEPAFFIGFGQRKLPASFTRLDQQGPICEYILDVEIPQLVTTGWTTSSVPVSMYMESGDGDVIAKVDVGTFVFADDTPSSTYPDQRKRKYSTDSTDLDSSVKRLASQHLRPKDDFSQYAAYGSNASSYMSYPPAPVMQSTNYGLAPQYNKQGVYSNQRNLGPSYPNPVMSTTMRSSSGHWGTSYPSLHSMRSPGLSSSTGLSRSLLSPGQSNPTLVRTTCLQQSPSLASTSHGLMPQYNSYPLYPSRAQLEIDDDLDSMTTNWTNEEWQASRRLVLFTRSQSGSTVTTKFKPVNDNEKHPDGLVISCIIWPEKKECFITLVDIIALLEVLVTGRFTVEEKNRIRRNLEGYRPLIVSKAKHDSAAFYKTIMDFPPPRPRNIEKDIKVLYWKDLTVALKKIVGKYSASPSSFPPSSPSSLTPIGSSTYLGHQNARSWDLKPTFVETPVTAGSPLLYSRDMSIDIRKMEGFGLYGHERVSSSVQPGSDDAIHISMLPVEQRSLSNNACEEIEGVVRHALTHAIKSDSKDKNVDDSEELFTVRFRLHCDLKHYMREHYGHVSKERLGRAIVLVAGIDLLGAQATTAEAYIYKNWPQTGCEVLGLLQRFVDSEDIVSEKGLRVSLDATITQAPIFTVCTSMIQLIEIAQIFAWLGCVFRTAHLDTLETSTCQISFLGFINDLPHFQLQFFNNPLPVTKSDCWKALFPGQVVATNFPLPQRTFDDGNPVGLEIPVNMMVALVGACKIVEFNGGVLIKGFSGMFIPVSCAKNYIQWHYIQNQDNSRMSYLEADRRYPERARIKEVSFEDVKTKRGFLGWAENSTYHLGASDSNYDNIDWTNTQEPKRALEFSGGSLGFQNFGTGELNFVPGLKQAKLHISHSGSYSRIVKHSSKIPIVLYDPDDQRGWLVPASAVIAHLAQTRRHREKYHVDGNPVEFVSTDTCVDLFKGAEDMLFKNAALKLSEDEIDRTSYSFKDLVLNIWSMLEAIVDENVRKELSQRPQTKVTIHAELQGWEFMDIADERPIVRQKSTSIPLSHGGWSDFCKDINAIILFGSGLEDLIRPSANDNHGLCRAWQRVPKNKQYLTTSVSMVNRLYEEAGSKLTKQHLTSTRLRWHKSGMLFERCQDIGSYSCKCNRAQQIINDSSIMAREVNTPGILGQTGAVVFGKSTASLSMRMTKSKPAQDSFYSLRNVEISQTTHVGNLSLSGNDELCTSKLDGVSTSSPGEGHSKSVEYVRYEQPVVHGKCQQKPLDTVKYHKGVVEAQLSLSPYTRSLKSQGRISIPAQDSRLCEEYAPKNR